MIIVSVILNLTGKIKALLFMQSSLYKVQSAGFGVGLYLLFLFLDDVWLEAFFSTVFF